VLNDMLQPDKISKIEVHSGGEPVVLEKGPGQTWALPGKWPTRRSEADDLVNAITSLHSRFELVPLKGDSPDLHPFGLDESQKPVTVEIEPGSHKLIFGEPEVSEGSVFARPTYVRVDGKPEVVRLGPDILPILKRPREYYQRRQLFPNADRIKFADASPANPLSPTPEPASGPVAIPRAKSLTLEGPQGKVVLN
jgi:hypothetical protein